MVSWSAWKYPSATVLNVGLTFGDQAVVHKRKCFSVQKLGFVLSFEGFERDARDWESDHLESGWILAPDNLLGLNLLSK